MSSRRKRAGFILTLMRHPFDPLDKIHCALLVIPAIPWVTQHIPEEGHDEWKRVRSSTGHEC
eukprot:5280286-Pyramimonas_sp.AAC.1